MALSTGFWIDIYPVVSTIRATGLCSLVSTGILCRHVDT